MWCPRPAHRRGWLQEVAFAEVEAELFDARDKLAEAEAAASTARDSAGVSRDQFLRLTADFENFRRRTVGGGGAVTALYEPSFVYIGEGPAA